MRNEQNKIFRAVALAGVIMAAMYYAKTNLPSGGADQENLRFAHDVFNRSAGSKSEDPDGARQRWLNIGNGPLKSGCNIVLELPEIVVTPSSNKSERKARNSMAGEDYEAIECKI
ncbi:MAG: hypothetical protein WBK55_09340 [Alphaproteobacteria bacterium]